MDLWSRFLFLKTFNMQQTEKEGVKVDILVVLIQISTELGEKLIFKTNQQISVAKA